MAMNENDFIYKELEHMRMIHFSTMAISVTLICLLISLWNQAPEINNDVVELQRLTNKLSAKDPRVSYIDEQISQNSSESISKRVNRIKLLATAPSQTPLLKYLEDVDVDARSRIISTTKIDTTQPVGKVIASLFEEPRSVEVISEIILDDLSKECLSAIKTLLEIEKSRYSMPTEFQIPVGFLGPFMSQQCCYNRSDLYMKLEKIENITWPQTAPEKVGSAELAVEISLVGSYEAKIVGDDKTRFASHSIHEKVHCVTHSKLSSVEIPLSLIFREWYSHNLPNLQKNIGKLSDLRFEEVYNFLKHERTAGISEQKLTFLGLSFGTHGEFIVQMGIIINIACFLYLVIYLLQLREYIGNFKVSGFISPWIVTRSGVISRALEILTVILAPTVSAMVSMWRIFASKWYIILLVTAIFLLVGIVVCFAARDTRIRIGEQRLKG